jgi:hypothetical protein
MATVLDIIKRARRVLNIDAVGDTLSAEEGSEGLAILNELLSIWSNEEAALYKIESSTYLASIGVSSYTVGPGASWNGARPIKIETAIVRDNTDPASPLDSVITQMMAEEYDTIPTKSVSGRPTEYVLYTTYPQATVLLYPTPDKAYQVVISQLSQFTEFADINEGVSVPPVYIPAMVYNLALMLAPNYGVRASDAVAAAATRCMLDIKTVNSLTRVHTTEYDPYYGGYSESYDITRGY